MGMSEPMDFPCPVCNAAPKQNCVRIDGAPMPSPHTKRKALALGIRDTTREDVTHAATLIVREESSH